MKLGIIGGSGFYAMPGLEDVKRLSVDTPWGAPSDELLCGTLEGIEVVFLPRHAPGHRIAPAEINYRANIAALKAVGCTAVVSVAACGSFKDDLPPGALCLCDQIIDRTYGRPASFFGDGIVAHISLADPIVHDLTQALAKAADAAQIPYQVGGTYLAIQGPRFQTRAESRLAKAQGLDVVGMTAMPEASLCREAEIAYALAAFVTDFDSWKDEAVTTTSILEVMKGNVANGHALVRGLCRELAQKGLAKPSIEGWENALDYAMITPKSAWPKEATERLRFIAPRLFEISGETV